jgi:hypothetical protein
MLDGLTAIVPPLHSFTDGRRKRGRQVGLGGVSGCDHAGSDPLSISLPSHSGLLKPRDRTTVVQVAVGHSHDLARMRGTESCMV